MKTVAIIPARGGSKRIPRKNVLPLMGKPLIAWTIEQAKRSVDKVYVSTDDHEIVTAAWEYGATAITRPADLSHDLSTSEEVIEHTLSTIEEQPETVVFLQCTSPIRQPDDLDKALALFRDLRGIGEPVSVFSACHVGNIWESRSTTVHPLADSRVPKQQRWQKFLHENGSFYIFDYGDFRAKQSRHCGTPIPYYMHPLDSFQIDEPSDIELIESLWPLRMCSVEDLEGGTTQGHFGNGTRTSSSPTRESSREPRSSTSAAMTGGGCGRR